MLIGIFGDHHASRSLPHSASGKRYEFQKKLLWKVLQPFDLTIHLGDLTHKKNHIDGKILEDYYNIFKGKKSIHLLGNHDRSRNGDKYVSMVEILSEMIDGLEVVTDIEKYKLDGVNFLATSYYADAEDISNNLSGQTDYCLGHWNFYNSNWKTGKKMKPRSDVRYILGHDHNPKTRGNVKYIGCMNPLRFGEKQGEVLAFDDGEVKVWDYPFGEKFIVTDEEIEVDEPKNTYMKLVVDNLSESERLKEKYSNLAHFSIKYDTDNNIGTDVVEPESNIKTHTDYLEEACEELGYDPDELKDYHNKISAS